MPEPLSPEVQAAVDAELARRAHAADVTRLADAAEAEAAAPKKVTMQDLDPSDVSDTVAGLVMLNLHLAQQGFSLAGMIRDLIHKSHGSDITMSHEQPPVALHGPGTSGRG